MRRARAGVSGSGQSARLDDEVVVAEALPLGESHPPEVTGPSPAPLHSASRAGSASPAGASPRSSGTTPGVLAQPGELLAREPPGAGGQALRQLGGVQLAGADGGDLARADHLQRLAGDARGVERGLQLGHEPLVELPPHALGDAAVERLARARHGHDQGRPARRGGPEGVAGGAPRLRPPPGRARAGAGWRRPRGPPRRDRGDRSAARAASGSRAARRSAQSRAAGAASSGNAQVGERGPQVEARAARDDRRAPGGGAGVDRGVRAPREPGRRGALGQREVAHAVVAAPRRGRPPAGCRRRSRGRGSAGRGRPPRSRRPGPGRRRGPGRSCRRPSARRAPARQAGTATSATTPASRPVRVVEVAASIVHRGQRARLRGPGEVDRDVLAQAAAQPRRVGARGALDQHLARRADEAGRARGGGPLHHLHQPADALALDLGRRRRRAACRGPRCRAAASRGRCRRRRSGTPRPARASGRSRPRSRRGSRRSGRSSATGRGSPRAAGPPGRGSARGRRCAASPSARGCCRTAPAGAGARRPPGTPPWPRSRRRACPWGAGWCSGPARSPRRRPRPAAAPRRSPARSRGRSRP